MSQFFEMRPPRPYLVWSIAFAMGLLHLWRIQDIPWINDEPQLILKALAANADGVLAQSGLTGSFGVAYSPIVVWLYQGTLYLTSNIFAIALLKTGFSLLLLYVGAAVLQRETKLVLPGVLLIFSSPYIWFYNRIVWDNVFLIPLSLLLLALLASFLNRPTAWKVYLLGLLCVLCLHVHLMALIPILALVVTLAMARRRQLLSEWKWYLPTLVGAVLLLTPYLVSLKGQVVASSAMHSAGLFDSLRNAWTGFRFFSHWQFDHIFHGYYDAPVLVVGLGLTLVFSGALFLAGLVRGMRRWLLVIRGRGAALASDWVNLYALSTIVLMMAFFVVTRAIDFPHYFNASWCAYLIFIWNGLDLVWSRVKWAGAAYFVFLMVTVSLTFSLLEKVHRSHGDKSIYYGPTLQSQVAVARSIAPYVPHVEVDAGNSSYRYFPQALASLVLLELKRQGLPGYAGSRRSFVVRFVTGPQQRDGRMEVIGISAANPTGETVP